ncbi:hypothetical protein [Mesoplasma melaleucae]|uniref:Uncharacterized protein n=1 Tax=Mesoplasma melaleucae TaxID=81459 RepID=A0A2K8NWR8_9MOLU|nr:hypothetical protein [Mesoplasma melaleucae]ATZ18292.1 hypothetical protein EMELA_v1c08050 [Mesoplasma melaleucae]
MSKINLDHVNEIYSNIWKFESLLKSGKYYPLFTNELRQEGGAFKSKVKLPLMLLAKTGKTWTQEDGIPVTDAHEKIVEVELDQIFNSHIKIDKANVPADSSTWAGNKAKTITLQEGQELDTYTLKAIAQGVSKKIEAPSELNKDTIVDFFTVLEETAEEQKFALEDAIIFVSPKVRNEIVKAKLECVDRNVENTSVRITEVLGYNVVTAPIHKQGYDFIALPPQAYAWALAIHTALQSYEYTQGDFIGQLATVVNEFYGSKVVMPEMVIGIPVASGETRTFNSELIDAKGRIQELENLLAISKNSIRLTEEEKLKVEEEKAELLAKVESLEKELDEVLASEEKPAA